MATLLTAVGLYGVVSASVAQRRREIGLRLALGARPGGLMLRMLGEAVGVSPYDLRVYALVVVGLLAVTLMAAWVPAARASRIDPGEVLKRSAG